MMRWQGVAVVAVLLAGAFVAGRWSVEVPEAAVDGGGTEKKGRAGSGARIEVAEDAPAPRMRVRRERQAEDRKVRAGTTEVPRQHLEEMVAATYLRGNLDTMMMAVEGHDGTSFEAALRMLGADEAERRNAMAVMKQAGEELRQAEQRMITVNKAATVPDMITLDRSAMMGISREVAERTKAGLEQVLPPQVSKVVLEGVSWGSFYMNPRMPEVKLSLEGTNSGGMRTRMNDGYREDVGFARTDIPRNGDGTYPAEKIFPKWKELVGGMTLMPTEGQ
ncbi:hypothetical protein OVA24_04885 [Luteolibacter sp. SL250]|uniref:hypothetical protein n=1 Tax=Luteolibacter sp. SL250 TaxID=2995170 RepID=UPI00226E6D0B|nr:hypothetical protein [Luteolibacter sp. SL250]WAC20715.1 hypothetical protein OVA24_04885 [Luteolibacter sp. SL250]